MKRFSMVVLAVLALVGLAEPLAQASELKYSSFSCGDHWLRIDVELDEKTKTANIELSGDSNPDPSSFVGYFEFTDQYSVSIHIPADGGSRIEIDGSDFQHDIFWGSYFSGPDGRETTLGLCSVEYN